MRFKIKIFEFYGENYKTENTERIINNWLKEEGHLIDLFNYKQDEHCNYNLHANGMLVSFNYREKSVQDPNSGSIIQVKIFRDYNSDKLNNAINNWLQENQDGIEYLQHTQSLVAEHKTFSLFYKIKVPS